MTTLNRRLTETLTAGNTTSELLKYRVGARDKMLLASGSGTFAGATVTLRRNSPGGSEATAIDTWTAAFAEVAVPTTNGDFYFTIAGGGGTESIAVTLEVSKGS